MSRFYRALCVLVVGPVLSLVPGCGGGGGTRPQVDGTPPGAVSDLAVSSTSDSSVTLTWTAPGDDGQQGTAGAFDLRHRFDEITAGNWNSATVVSGEPRPETAGTPVTFTVLDLIADTTYFFALKSADEVSNWSALSNVVSASTDLKLDTVPPGRVTDLSVDSMTNSSVTLRWTAPGDDDASGTPAAYDLRYGLSEITDGTWPSAAPVDGEPAPGEAGSEETFTVENLESNTTYYFGLKAADEVPNVSPLSNIVGATTTDDPDTTAPSAVVDLDISRISSSSVTLVWTAPGDDAGLGTAAAYDVRYASSEITDATWSSATAVDLEPAPSESGSPETFTVTGLTPYTHYCFALRAVDEAANESGLSNVVCEETNAPPAAAFTVDPVSGTLATVFHFDASGSSDAEDPPSALEYHWDWNGDGAADLQTTGVVDADYQFAQTGIRPVILTVVDTRGASDRDTVEVQVTELPDETPPTAVGDLAVQVSASTSVTLTWTAPGDDGSEGTAAQYDLRYAAGDSSGFTWSSATEVQGEPAPAPAGSNETFTVTGLDPNTRYTFAVKTRDDAGNWSLLSNLIEAVTNTPPNASLTVDPVSGTTADVFEFDGSASADGEDPPASLEFHWDWENDGVFDHVGTGHATATHQFPDADTYEVVLKVVDSLGLSDQDTFQVIVADGIAPEAVVDLAVGTVTYNSVELTWTAPGDDGTQGTADLYDLRYDTQPITEGTWADAVPVAGVPAPLAAGTPEAFVIPGLTPETSYSFALKTADEASNLSGLSNVVSAETESEFHVPEMALVPHGAFTMGDGEAYCGSDERSVTLSRDFHLGCFEVTNQQYVDWVQWAYDHGYVTATSSSVSDALDGSSEELLDLGDPDCEIRFSGGEFDLRDAGHGVNPDHPVKEVTWYGAAAFCDWLSLKEGVARAYDHSTWECHGGDPYGAVGYRLPTDAEWEFAAQYDDERVYPWGSQDPTCGDANFAGCVGWTAAVGSYPGAPLIGGALLYDMAGNVWEWCNDWHYCDLGGDPATDPPGPSTGLRRVLRGGAWDFVTFYPRCAYRSDSFPYVSYTYIGFRIARTAAD